ncbi:MAG: DUF4878 domain-containing protein [Cyanosarcina radialis HA8281-LM2]|jgi:hypothetical protein|nr:DUF4878 domain-containing protein [Cyanosarcina radialis HA8281-LM2]
MKRRKFISIGVSSCLVTSLAGCSFANTPSGTVKLFFQRLEKGEIEKAKELVSKSVLALGSKLDAGLAQISNEIKQAGGIKSIETKNEQITGEVARVEYSVVLKNDRPQNDNADLLKEDGSWKIGKF